MMNEGLKKFEELLKNDSEFQGKLKAAAEKYTGEKTEKAAFEGLLVPLGKEYGITATYEEYKEYMEELRTSTQTVSDDELAQIAGGTKGGGGKDAGGIGAAACAYVGVGLGGGAQPGTASYCLGLGIGNTASACMVEGVTGPGLF